MKRINEGAPTYYRKNNMKASLQNSLLQTTFAL